MAKTKPIPVRLEPQLIRRLDVTAHKLGSTRATLIKYCACSFLEEFTKRGMSMIPSDFDVIIAGLDNRTKVANKGRSKTSPAGKKTGRPAASARRR